MDLSRKEKDVIEGVDRQHFSHHIVDSFFPSLWDGNHNAQQMVFSESLGTGNALVGRLQQDPISKAGSLFLQSSPGTFPPTLPHFQADSAFIERAARFSCFGASGFGSASSPFVLDSTIDPCMNIEGPALGNRHQKNNANLGEESAGAMDVGNSVGYDEQSGDAENSGQGENSNSMAVKKRKKCTQSTGKLEMMGESSNPLNAKENTASKHNVTPNTEVPQKKDDGNSKMKGKQAKDGEEQQKVDYIHIRARRGQATNSHSLAERVRREKISERMKFLQDLVPGCSKVTGKAVMLDEIINYVQSLQRQVEFLSMKLAAVNPEVELNIEGLLSKDMFQSHAGPPSSFAFSNDMALPLLQHNQQTFEKSVISGMIPSLDVHSRAISTQMAGVDALSGSKLQMVNLWQEEEFRNSMQIDLTGNPPLNIRDVNGKTCTGFPT